MTNNVVTLADAKAKPVPECVDICRRMLALAESGEMREVCFFWTGTGGVLNSEMSQTADQFARLGHIERLRHRMQTRMDEATK